MVSMEAPGTKDLAQDLLHPWVNMVAPFALIVLALFATIYFG